MLEQRLNEVESQLMYLQKTVDDLGQVMIEQSLQLSTQAKEIARLKNEISGLGDSLSETPRRIEDDKPPHY